MKNNDSNALLTLIDNRIRKIIKEQNICYRYIAKITAVTDGGVNGSRVSLKLAGFTEATDPAYSLVNQSGVTLAVGDYVYINTIGDKMNTGVIVQKYL